MISSPIARRGQHLNWIRLARAEAAVAHHLGDDDAAEELAPPRHFATPDPKSFSWAREGLVCSYLRAPVGHTAGPRAFWAAGVLSRRPTRRSWRGASAS
jgi:hypothetical protein